MSDKVGPVRIADEAEVSPALREVRINGFSRALLTERTQLVESETRKLCNDALKAAHALLEQHAQAHELLAAALLEHEDLTADEMKLVVAGKAIPARA